jgi:2,3-diketo-5-methylthio-1-phosphopentane phosphatase
VRRALILDFDGTIVERDVGDDIADRFGEPGWRRLNERWARGEISLLELQREVWPRVRGSAEEILALVDRSARFRPGLAAMLERALAAGTRIVVASGGYDFYIRRSLSRLGALAERIEVISNEGRLEGGGVVARYPHAAGGCGRCSVCKGAVIDAIAGEGFEPWFCGDGSSDRCAAGRARRLFAVRGSRLARQCAASGVACEEFESFDLVTARLESARAGERD